MIGKLLNTLTKESHWPWIFSMAIAVTVAIFLLKFVVTGFGVYGDGLGYYTPLRSLLFDGDLRVNNEYQYYADTAAQFRGSARVFGPIPEYSKYTLGLGIVLLPFFVVGHIFALVVHLVNPALPVNGLSWPYELSYCLGSIFFGIASLVLSYHLARRYFSRTACILAVGGVWFGSPLSYYLLIEVSMSHAVSAFLIALFLTGIFTRPWQKDWRWQGALGITLGMAAWVRPQDVLFVLVPLLIAVLGFETPASLSSLEPLPPVSFQSLRNRFLWRSLLVLIGVACLMQLPQILIYLWQYGGLEKIPYLEEGKASGSSGSFHWFQPALWQVLFSGHRGLFIWHPLTLLGILGLGLTWRQFPRLNSALLIGFFAQVYFIAAWWCWWQGASVGGRMFANCTLAFVFGLAALWDYRPGTSWQKWGLGITLFLIGWNALIVLQYQSGMIPPEAPITLRELYQNQFQVIPYFLQHLMGKF
ncbi:MAG: hypothetical protein VKJ27_00865 [Synechocystis sp.]|nr:hypothetical protein [Synechocystis sp.]